MKKEGWRPHQRGDGNMTWKPPEFQEFAEAAHFFDKATKQKKKNRGIKRRKYWEKVTGSSGPSEVKQQPREKDQQWHGQEQTAKEVKDSKRAHVSEAPIETAVKLTPKALKSGATQAGPIQLGPCFPRPSVSPPPSPSLHGDQPGSLFHFPHGATMWVPKAAMEHISWGMDKGDGCKFLDQMWPFETTGHHSEMRMRRPMVEEIMDDDEEEGLGRNSSSSSSVIQHPWKRSKQ